MRFEKTVGLKHSSHISGSRLSSRHSYSMNCVGVIGSPPEKVKTAARLVLTSGGFSTMKVSGGVRSVPSMSMLTGVGSTFPARSTARTSNVKRPSSISGTDQGLEQPYQMNSGSIGSHGGVGSGASVSSFSIRRHSNWSSSSGVRLSAPVNRKATVSIESWIGPEMNSVSGGVSSNGGGGPSNS